MESRPSRIETWEVMTNNFNYEMISEPEGGIDRIGFTRFFRFFVP